MGEPRLAVNMSPRWGENFFLWSTTNITPRWGENWAPQLMTNIQPLLGCTIGLAMVRVQPHAEG